MKSGNGGGARTGGRIAAEVRPSHTALAKLDVNIQLSIVQLISRTAEYALRAIIWLIQEPARSQTTRQIAAGTKAPPDYVSKVLQALARANVVRSRRGLGGGFYLACDPAQVSVLDVINAVDPLERIHTCPLGLKAHATQLCPLHCGLNEAVAHFETTFGHAKLSDLLNGDSPSVPLGIKLPVRRRLAAPRRAARPNARRSPAAPRRTASAG